MQQSIYLSRPMYHFFVGICLLCYSGMVLAANLAATDAIGSGQLRTVSTENAKARRIQQATLLSTHADIDVNAISTAVTLTQTFKNNSDDWVEGTYVFPLPDNAAVDAMTLKIGDKTIVGKIRAKQKAKKIYQAAVKNGQKAALIEQSRDNLFTAKAGNIPPQSTVSIILHYVQSTALNAGQFSLRLPTTYTPRYIVRNDDADVTTATIERDTVNETEPAIAANLAANSTVNSAATAISAANLAPQTFSRTQHNPISIRVTLDAGHTITALGSPSHTVQQTRHADNRSATVTFAQPSVAMDRDFILTWVIEKSEQPLALAFSEAGQQGHFTSLLFIPPTQSTRQHTPRETIFIIDTSGSMSGAAMRQAKAGALMALSYLREGDAFNLVAFNSDYSLLFPQSTRVSATSINHAKQFIQQLAASGGTNMHLPLTAVLSQQPLAEHFRQVVFLTDGAVNNERALFNLIHKKLDKTRLFTIGIGAAPNSFFMRQAAKFGRGTFTYIAKIDEVSEKITALFQQIQSPQLTDIRVAVSQQSNADIYPNPLPDLYLGEPVVAHIKTPHSLNGQSLTVSGKQHTAANRWRTDITVLEAAKLNTAKLNTGLAKLWAREKINHLETLNITSGDFVRHNADILQLGLDYQLVTSQTSFVAVEEKISRDTLTEPLKKKAVANQMPAGNSMSFPTTSTSSTLTLLLGAVLFIIALLLALIARYRREYNAAAEHDYA